MTRAHGLWLCAALLGVSPLAIAGDDVDALFTSSFETGEAPPPPPAGSLSFQDTTAQAIGSTLDSDARFDALWVDFNSDGCSDAFIFAHADFATSRLWVNRCDGSNTFTYVDNAQARYFMSSPEVPRGSGWITLLDTNGDGRQDYWLRDATTLAARYINGTSAVGETPYFSHKEAGCDDHCVFGDIDGDGGLDVIRQDRRVQRMSGGAQIHPAAGSAGDRIVTDVNGDSWPDLVQPNAGGYWRNEQGALSWRAASALQGNKTLLVSADFDNDGHMDLLSYTGDDNSGTGGAHLYRNDGSGGFVDVTAGSGIDQLGYTAWWTGYGNIVAADLDNDGLQDLVIAGAAYTPAVTLLRNTGSLRFATVNVDLGNAVSGNETGKSRAAVADYDNDGLLDIVKTQTASNIGIWHNTTPTGGARWMKVRVRGSGPNTDGIGADVRWYRAGTNTLVSHMDVQATMQHAQTWLHTGLGAETEVDLEVRFPHGGPTHRFANVASNQEVIVYASGCLVEGWQPGNGWSLTAPGSCSP